MDFKELRKRLMRQIWENIQTEPPPVFKSAAVSEPQVEKPGEPKSRADDGEPSKTQTAEASPAPEPESSPDAPNPEGDTLRDRWQAALEQLPERERELLLRRFGLSGRETETLQSLGASLDITRERVRQLERRTLTKIFEHPGMAKQTSEHIARYSSDDSFFLTVDWLRGNDPWFRGAETQVIALAIERAVQPQRLYCIKIEQELYVADFSRATWDLNLKRAREMLKNRAAEQPPPRRSELRRELARLLSDDAESGWGGLLLERAYPRALFATVSETSSASGAPDADEVLVSLSTSAEGYVAKILLEIERPMHFREISKLIQEKYKFKIDERRTHNALGNHGYLFDRGVYGSLRHLPISPSAARALVRQVEELALGDAFSGQQWHCNEMLKALRQAGQDVEGLNVYLLHTLLRLHSERLDDLGRQMWIAGSGRVRDTGRRVRLFETAEEILEEHGAPMPNQELCRLVAERRGRSKTLALHPRGRLVRTDQSEWGLIDRDVLLSAEQIEQFVQAVLTRLEKGSAVTDVDLPALAESVTGVAGLYPVMLVSLLQLSGRISVGREGEVRIK
ncbi:MAG: hypothetical protein ISN29_10075 [Gammaproteobacteria bacterium AqS3]|nr:hypothetical protein [Gammaproteobacteria bacterium AqS3]